MKYYAALLLLTSSPLPQARPTATGALPPAPPVAAGIANRYAWLPAGTYDARRSVAARFAPPRGCRRVAVAPGSFGHWLRYLPLLPAGTAVHLYDGTRKERQDVHAAVVKLDVGRQDLQQCADAVIRLRAEYLFAQDPALVHFHLTSGDDIRFADWYGGRGFRVRGSVVEPVSRPPQPPTHAVFRQYLDRIFTYAGTLSLARELLPVLLTDVQPGDVLVYGGSPGHAVIVLDVAEHAATGRRYVLLAQSYMPAQQLHVLRNEGGDAALGAWFAVSPQEKRFHTPEWTFGSNELMRF
ncbi:DUF4846 domain-containing protein [Hymenobacter algoricola]|uniref:DUF4846 domain-containing protein n=1 Tax=Hymenobacter algoricola TaxID=486267 RepID=A0ABP7MQ92_9BACT